MDSKNLPGWLVVSLPDQPSVSEPAGAHGGSASAGAHGERAGAGAGDHSGRAILGLLPAPSSTQAKTSFFYFNVTNFSLCMCFLK